MAEDEEKKKKKEEEEEEEGTEEGRKEGRKEGREREREIKRKRERERRIAEWPRYTQTKRSINAHWPIAKSGNAVDKSHFLSADSFSPPFYPPLSSHSILSGFSQDFRDSRIEAINFTVILLLVPLKLFLFPFLPPITGRFFLAPPTHPRPPKQAITPSRNATKFPPVSSRLWLSARHLHTRTQARHTHTHTHGRTHTHTHGDGHVNRDRSQLHLLFHSK